MSVEPVGVVADERVVGSGELQNRELLRVREKENLIEMEWRGVGAETAGGWRGAGACGFPVGAEFDGDAAFDREALERGGLSLLRLWGLLRLWLRLLLLLRLESFLLRRPGA